MSMRLYSEALTHRVVLGGKSLPDENDRRNVKVLEGVQFARHTNHPLYKSKPQVYVDVPVEWQTGGGFFLELPPSTTVAVYTTLQALISSFPPRGSAVLLSDQTSMGGKIGEGIVPYREKVDIPDFGFLVGT